MKVLIQITLLLATGCKTVSLDYYYKTSEFSVVAENSKNAISIKKKAAERLSLLEKAEHFEKYISSKMHPRWKFCPKLYTKEQPGTLRTDMTALYLSSMAFKYAVTKNDQDKSHILMLLASLYEADRINNLDGFLPYKVKIVNDQLTDISNETHINVYTQLFFAYFSLLELCQDDEIHHQVRKHLILIVDHLQKYDFKLVDHQQKQTDYSDISPSFFAMNGSRKLALLVLLDAGLKYFPQEPFREKLLSAKENALDYGYYEEITDLHFRFLNLEFPTHSSSWLNMLSLYNGFLISEEKHYQKAYENLMKEYEDEKNLLFVLIGYYINKNFTESTLPLIEKQLKEFPLRPNSQEIINSLLLPNQIAGSSQYIKLKRITESSVPLPFYRRPMRAYEWKLNQMRMDGNFAAGDQVTYSGMDYLQAYWMYRFLKK